MNKEKLDVDLTNIDGNAFAIMGAIRKEAIRAGWAEEEIEEVLEDMRSGDYDHLVQVAIEVCY